MSFWAASSLAVVVLTCRSEKLCVAPRNVAIRSITSRASGAIDTGRGLTAAAADGLATGAGAVPPQPADRSTAAAQPPSIHSRAP